MESLNLIKKMHDYIHNKLLWLLFITFNLNGKVLFYGLFHLTGLLYKEQSYINQLYKVITKCFLKDIFYQCFYQCGKIGVNKILIMHD